MIQRTRSAFTGIAVPVYSIQLSDWHRNRKNVGTIWSRDWRASDDSYKAADKLTFATRRYPMTPRLPVVLRSLIIACAAFSTPAFAEEAVHIRCVSQSGSWAEIFKITSNDVSKISDSNTWSLCQESTLVSGERWSGECRISTTQIRISSRVVLALAPMENHSSLIVLDRTTGTWTVTNTWDTPRNRPPSQTSVKKCSRIDPPAQAAPLF